MFHNRSQHWAILSNIALKNVRSTKQFLDVGIERDGRWFRLVRYHNSDFARLGPEALAKFMGLPVSDIFPITYDISDVAIGDTAVLRGTIFEELEEHLTEDQRLKLSLED